MNRHTGELSGKTYVSNPFFFFHTINAFQKGSAVIIDLVGWQNLQVVQPAMLITPFIPDTALARCCKDGPAVPNPRCNKTCILLGGDTLAR